MKGQLTVRLTDELEEQVESLARKLHRKRSDVVRLALERFIQEEEEAQGDRPYDRVKNLIGSVESGVPDLGLNHREHLKSMPMRPSSHWRRSGRSRRCSPSTAGASQRTEYIPVKHSRSTLRKHTIP